MTARTNSPSQISALPHAVENFEDVIQELKGKKPAVFLDYDGTLTEIAEHPDLAVLSLSMGQSLGRLAAKTLTGIISGRDLNNIRSLVQRDELLYAGSHGFDLYIPGQGRLEPHAQPAELKQVQAELQKLLVHVSGVILERKRYSLAVHYRQAQDANQPVIQSHVDAVLQKYPHLRQFGGKKIIEIQPDIQWDKGRALFYILDLLPQKADYTPLYIGDDTTDEDAFAVLTSWGIGICVSAQDRLTQATYRLHSVHEVQVFIERLSQWLDTRPASS